MAALIVVTVLFVLLSLAPWLGAGAEADTLTSLPD